MDTYLVNKRYLVLQQTLEVLPTRRLRLRHSVQFLEDVISTGEELILGDHAVDFLTGFCHLVAATDLTGMHLVFVGKLRRVLGKVRDQCAVLGIAGFWNQASNHLDQYQTRVYHWLSRRHTGAAFVEGRPRDEENRDARAWIPITEHEGSSSANPPEFATLRNARVKVLPGRKGSVDDVLVCVNVIDDGGRGMMQVRNALAAARYHLQRFHPKDAEHRLHIEVRFDGDEPITPESLDAGLAAIMFIALLRHAQHEDEYYLPDTVAFTGRLDIDGRFMPIDEVGLRLKVEAATFSWLNHLVVPRQQAEQARRYAMNLVRSLTDHPEDMDDSPVALHPVEIIGMDSLQDVFLNRSTSHSRHVPRLRSPLYRLFDWRRRTS